MDPCGHGHVVTANDNNDDGPKNVRVLFMMVLVVRKSAGSKASQGRATTSSDQHDLRADLGHAE